MTGLRLSCGHRHYDKVAKTNCRRISNTDKMDFMDNVHRGIGFRGRRIESMQKVEFITTQVSFQYRHEFNAS